MDRFVASNIGGASVTCEPELLLDIPIRGNTKSRFVNLLLSCLEKNYVRYCVLHNWEELPDNLSTDLDLAVHPEDRQRLGIVFDRLQGAGFDMIDCHNYEVGAHSFYFAWFDGATRCCVDVDVIFEYRGKGVQVLSSRELTDSRRAFRSFWIPAAPLALRYLIAKRILKLQTSYDKHEPIRQLAQEVGAEQATKVATDLLGNEMGRAMLQADTQTDLRPLLRKARKSMVLLFMRRHPFAFIRGFCGESLRVLSRVLHPTGMLVAILGPDGAGKSTIITEMLVQEMPEFQNRRVFHWRPQIIGRSRDTGPVVDPHSKTPRGSIGSLLRLAVFAMDHFFGYVLIVFPLLVRSGLVIYDRNFDDIIVDPVRYRYGGPQVVARAIGRLLRKPDLMIVLTAEVCSILSRKPEVGEEYLIELRERYLLLAQRRHHSIAVSTNSTVAESVQEINAALIRRMNERFKRRHRGWTKGNPTPGQAQ